jgi:hypothetical protein
LAGDGECLRVDLAGVVGERPLQVERGRVDGSRGVCDGEDVVLRVDRGVCDPGCVGEDDPEPLRVCRVVGEAG